MTLYIIGNGFDIAHGIKCKYSDFGDFLGENYSGYYESVVNAYCHSNYLWKDFESELPSCATHIEEWGLQMGNEMRDEIDYDPMDDMGIGRWLDSQFNFLNKLPKYLRLWVESIDVNKSAVYKIKSDALFLNFNYTATLENVYSIDPDNVKHIHGFVENKKEILVLGHCDQQTISYAQKKKQESQEAFLDHAISTFDRVAKYCETTLKRTEKIIEDNFRFFEQLFDTDEVIVIGHSFGKVDMPYFKKVLDSVSDNANWIAYYFEETDQTKFENSLLDLGVRKENISVRKTTELFL